MVAGRARHRGALALLTAAFAAVVVPAFACETPIGRIVAARGELVLIEPGGATRPATLDMSICAGEVLRTGPFATATIVLEGHGKAVPNLRIGPSSVTRIRGQLERRWWVDLQEGLLYVFSRQPQSLGIDTPMITASAEGTEFLVSADAARGQVIVYEGTVIARNPQGETTLASGQQVSAGPGEAPRAEIAVRPWDAVAWAIYYPPILLLDDTAGAPPAFGAALARARRGDLAGALADLDAAASGDAQVPARVLQAALLLSVGAVEAARAELGRALAIDPRAALAYALRSVIAVAQNDKATALADAQLAVDLDPGSTAAKIALSYALQADFRLVEARETMQTAVRDAPGNALAWARLAELWLAAGERRRAREAAEKAEALAPDLDRAQTILGFAYLVEIRTRRAREAFERAIALNSTDPLPHFGLGLARIRDGQLSRGRGDIETAVALDPASSLFRSYLGIAFFEERETNPLTYFRNLWERWPAQENTLAASQYELAKQLDPQDPTPWFYDAIRKQSENRPVEALRDLERSIALNDNRAVTRTQDLLNSDLAGRGASVARIYNDLGFEQLGINEATKAISLDPSNSAAHRFLSDVYATQPRRETARVSELLQAQLLQDVNINPVSPSFGQTNLGIFTGGGPSQLGLNEYTPLFERNQAQLNLSGVVGNHYTYGGEAVISGVYDTFSLSAGQLHYNTDGFQKNYDIDNNITNIFSQIQLADRLNFQGEIIARRSDFGSLFLPYQPDDFTSNIRHDLDEDIFRIGSRYSVTTDQDVIASVIADRRNLKGTLKDGGSELSFKDKGIQGEAAYLGNTAWGAVQIGFGRYQIDRDSRDFSIDIDGEDVLISDETQKLDVRQYSGYAYSNINFPEHVVWTAGLSYDNLNAPSTNRSKLSPKLGVEWQAMPTLRLRGAVFRVLAPPLVADRTIQPTQIAGFNQFFDDAVGTEAWVYALGADSKLSSFLTVGANTYKRSYDEPVTSSQTSVNYDSRREYFVDIYSYLTLSDRWVANASFSYDLFKGNPDSNASYPESLTTYIAPLRLNYFDNSGLFGKFTASFVYQDISERGGDTKRDGNDDAVVFDAGIGYRFPQRRGAITIDAYNIFDQHMRYQNDVFREFRDSFNGSSGAQGTSTVQSSRFLPNRTILASFTLNF